jgi:hypothetical protein
MPTLDALADAVADLRRRLNDAGRDPASITVQFQAERGRFLKDNEPLDRYLEWLAGAEAAGADQLIIELPPQAEAAVEGLIRYGEEVIARFPDRQGDSGG